MTCPYCEEIRTKEISFDRILSALKLVAQSGIFSRPRRLTSDRLQRVWRLVVTSDSLKLCVELIVAMGIK